MGVAPRTGLGVLSQILVADIVTADPGFLSVDHDDLAMVAKIDLETIGAPLGGVELVGLDAIGRHVRQIGVGQVVAADLVVKHANLHPLPGLGRQSIFELTAQSVGTQDVKLDQNIASARWMPSKIESKVSWPSTSSCTSLPTVKGSLASFSMDNSF
jgi:hypothetical protein